MNKINAFRLSDYLAAVQAVIRFGFEEGSWVKAEITAMSSKGGHYYFELAEKDPLTDKTIAVCRATLWKSHASGLIRQFKAHSGIELGKGLNVLVNIRATFSPQYGFSVNIEDIDSSYTLGDLAQKYQHILAQLNSENLLARNKQLPAPFDIQHVLVIAPEQAAGLGDFQKDAAILQQHGLCQFDYHSATFQGTSAPGSIQAALLGALEQWHTRHTELPDLLVIIRGGGAVNDLAYLNDYRLAAALAHLTIPVWVGIGHERDRTILDEIAHRSFDTPSKVIAGIRNHIASRAEQAQQFYHTIYNMAQQQFAAMQHRLDSTTRLIRHNSQYQLKLVSQQLHNQLKQQQTQAHGILQQAQQHTGHFIRELLLQSPQQTLKRGYALIRVNGRAVHSVQQLTEQTVQIQMQDGSAMARVNQILPVNLLTG